ncbi:tyrosine-type recombinase/integrase [Arcobacter porcinus]|uniref:Site-specific tyrosine recombinase, phage integrase family (INT_ICEBs1_C_like domain) n=1 Tax=Arcobacter porcinus TaxID=1935204 RepID=A0A5C2HE43_9BACT|nr:site-specific integrase [Arcobacter porcinus]OCL89401.1 site-specific tyrosine recombinase XerC [Aliarcobacter thereius]QEP40454.1 site-specific tyrosine recombinase, phage integrase family (INT_ICEBs1_C_like domain) [Arcobacter porcinus]
MNESINCSDGSFYERGGRIYVQATVNGRTIKKSTGRKVNSINKTWMKKQNPSDVLLNLLGVEKEKKLQDVSIENYGLKIINATSGGRGIETQKDFVRILEKTIVPFFKLYKLKDVKVIDILELLKRADNKFCNDRAKRVRSILNLIFTSAFEEGLIDKNLFSMQILKNHKFKRKPRKTKAYNVSEMKIILDNSSGWLKLFFELSFKYGLRTGETMGLKWTDFDLEKGYFRIQRSISKGVITESSKIIHENKNHLRDIYLFPETLELLKKYSNFKPNDEWLFVTKTGEPFMQCDTIRNYHVKPFLKKIGVEYKTVYATRRTYVSIMRQSEKIQLEDIQEVVGHQKGSNITDKHYNIDVLENSHKVKKAEEKARIFNDILSMA